MRTRWLLAGWLCPACGLGLFIAAGLLSADEPGGQPPAVQNAATDDAADKGAAADDAAAPATAAKAPAEKPQDKLSAATAAANFQSAFDEFKSYLARLRSLQSQFQVAEPEARQKIVDEFNDCVARCNQVVPRLQTSAVQAFEADPANRKAGDFLMANLVDAVESDRHWDGARLAKILADGGYPEKAFFNYAGIAEYGNQDFTQAKTDFANAQRVNIINKVAKEKCLPFVEECIPLWEAEKVVRAAEEEADDLPRVRLTTTKGDIVVELFENEVAQHHGQLHQPGRTALL